MINFKQTRWPAMLAASMALVLAYLLVRNHGLHPFVFYDELAYSTFSRLVPRAESVLPSWLYLWLFGAVNACGPGFLECSRALNALFFVASAPLVYLCARTVTDRPAAAIITVFSLLAPVNGYTAYFMPEAMYYFMFWLVTWAALVVQLRHWAMHALLVGFLLGLMATVKVHAMFMLPAIALFLAFRQWQAGGRWAAPALGSMAVALLAAVAVKFGVGYLLAGDAGLSLFGKMYGAHASGNTAMLHQKLGDAVLNARGHMMGILILFGFPLAAAMLQLFTRDERTQAPAQGKALQVYALLALGAPMAMTIMYTASIYAIEGLRVHTRYYDFAFPLLCMVGAALVGRDGGSARILRWVIGALVAVAVLLSIYHINKLFTLSYIDGPEFKSMKPAFIGGLTLVLLGLWAVGKRALARNAFVFAFLPLYIVHTAPEMHGMLRQMEKPSAFDSAGMHASATIPPAERGQLVIAGTGLAHLMRTKFYLDEDKVRMIELPEGAALAAGAVPVRSKWILVVGPHALPEGFEVVSHKDGFALLKQERAHRTLARIELGASHGEPAGLASLDGLGAPEHWGRWSTGKEITLQLREPMPASLNLIVTAQAFGPNVGQQVLVRVGQQERSFTATATPQEALLQFETDGQQKGIVIVVPAPASPKSLGMSPDDRTLGVGLVNIEIGTR